MNAYKIPNKKIINKVNNVGRKNIVSLKRDPKVFNKYTHFGEKIQETRNYILYASGNQKSYYEFFPKETQFKSHTKKPLNNLYNNKSCANLKNKKLNYPMNIHDVSNEKILNISENYGYKETYNIKKAAGYQSVNISNEIQDNEEKFIDIIKNALKKAHLVCYVEK